MDATSENADAAGVGGRHGAEKHLGGHCNLPRREYGEQAGAGCAVKRTAGHSRGRERMAHTGEHLKAFRRLQQRQAQARRARAPRVRLTGARWDGRKPSRHGAPGDRG